METKKLLEAISRLIKREVDNEVERRMKTIRMEIISEVAGMLNYTERKILMELSKGSDPVRQKSEESDFSRSMNNLKSMPGYRKVVENVEVPKKKKYSSHPLLDDILNNTDELRETPQSTSIMDLIGVTPQEESEVKYAEPWTNEHKIASTQTRNMDHDNDLTPSTILGTDNKPINLKDETVRNVMDILNNTDFKAKYDEMSAKGNNFRSGVELGGIPAPRFNSDYFKETTVD